MTFTRSAVAKGAGAVIVRRHSDDRILFLNTNTKYDFQKTETEGDKVQGMNSSGSLVDLDIAGQEEWFSLEIFSKKNTRNINEMVLGAEYIAKTGYSFPWAETVTPSGGSATLKGATSPTATTMRVTQLDTGTVFTATSGVPTAGQFKDNGDGTITFNAADNGKNLVVYYKRTANVSVQGGADYSAIGDVEIFFRQLAGTSSTANQVGADILWIPKAKISGDTTFEFSNDVQEKSFKATAVIPDTPTAD